MSDPRSVAGRPSDKAGLLGQVPTPAAIARRMAMELLADRGPMPVRLLDPCVGPGTFPVAIYESHLVTPADEIVSVDIDPRMLEATGASLYPYTCNHVGITADYLDTQFDGQFDYAILNPPYVRQEWIDKKSHYRDHFKRHYGLQIPGTSNLYVYFMVKVIMDLKKGGAFSCIVYDSWLVTGYGKWLMRFLLDACDPLFIEPVGAQPFDGRLIDATIVRGVRKPYAASTLTLLHEDVAAQLSNGPLAGTSNFKSLGGIFATKRGLRLKQADFFLTDLDDVDALGATPFVKKVAKIKGYMVPEEHSEAALIVQSGAKPSEAMAVELDRRLASALARPETNTSILTWQRERPATWYSHRVPPYAPLLFNYYIRGVPRHIFNPTRAYSDNFYGLMPKDNTSPISWLAVLNSTAASIEILSNARSQGAGLAKVQLFEYRRAQVFDIRQCTEAERQTFHELGLQLMVSEYPAPDVINAIDKNLYQLLGFPTLQPDRLGKVLSEVRSRFNRAGITSE